MERKAFCELDVHAMNNVTPILPRAELNVVVVSMITHLLVSLQSRAPDKDRRDPHFHKRLCVAPSVNPRGAGKEGRKEGRRRPKKKALLFVREEGKKKGKGE